MNYKKRWYDKMIKTSKKELKTIYDNAKSFYNKASVKRYYNKNELVYKIELISYKTSILYIQNNKLYFNYKNINNKNIYSMTTLRHIKEFIKQFYYLLELNYKNIIDKEVLKKDDIKALIKASVNN